MMYFEVLIAIYCVLIMACSLAGGVIPEWFTLRHRILNYFLSVASGVLLGVGLLHMLPHSVNYTGSLDVSVAWMTGGVVTTFLLIRVFSEHHHGVADVASSGGDSAHPYLSESAGHPPPSHEPAAGHFHPHPPGEVCSFEEKMTAEGVEPSPATVSHAWIAVFVGFALHTMVDGIALAASVKAAGREAPMWHLVGVGTFLAIVLHKPLGSLAIITLMMAGGWSRRKRQLINAIFSLMCPLGAFLFLWGSMTYSSYQDTILGVGLALSSGVFVCIALGELLPEVHFHPKERVQLTLLLIVGVFVAYLIGLGEPEHMHEADEAHAAAVGEG